MQRFQTRPITPTQVSAVQLRGPARVGKQKGRAGDYLVTKDGGVLEIIGARAFAATYEPVNGNGHGSEAARIRRDLARQPRKLPRRPKRPSTATATKSAPANPGRRGKLSDEQLARMRKLFEAGHVIDAIAKEFDVSGPTVSNRAKTGGWKRPARATAAPKVTAPAAPSAPRATSGHQLSGDVRCTNEDCGRMTNTDPCSYCGTKLKRKW